MQTLPIRGSCLRVTAPYGMSKRSVIVKAFKDETTSSVPEATSWQVPEQLKPVVTFLAAEDQKLESVVAPITKSELYTKYAASFVESPVAAQSIGWKKIPETVNGRLAMLGFTAGALAEIFVQKSLLTQFASLPQSVVVTVALITAATIIPVVKATEGDYLASLRDTYSIPEGVFTETNEKVLGRLAMLGIAGLIAIELLIGRALL